MNYAVPACLYCCTEYKKKLRKYSDSPVRQLPGCRVRVLLTTYTRSPLLSVGKQRLRRNRRPIFVEQLSTLGVRCRSQLLLLLCPSAWTASDTIDILVVCWILPPPSCLDYHNRSIPPYLVMCVLHQSVLDASAVIYGKGFPC